MILKLKIWFHKKSKERLVIIKQGSQEFLEQEITIKQEKQAKLKKTLHFKRVILS